MIQLLPAPPRHVARFTRCAIAIFLSAVTLLAPGTTQAGEWAVRTLQEVSFEAPGALEPGPDVLSSMPEETRKKMKSYDMKMAKDGARRTFPSPRVAPCYL